MEEEDGARPDVVNDGMVLEEEPAGAKPQPVAGRSQGTQGAERAQGEAAKATAFSSVVKIFVVKAEPNYAQPWQMRPQRASTGSGFVIAPGCSLPHHRPCEAAGATEEVARSALTACLDGSIQQKVRKAAWQRCAQIYLEFIMKLLRAVLTIGHVCDLALVTVSDPEFWGGLRSLQLADELPLLQDAVLVVGYPRGGDSLSVTKGVVSRLDMRRYSHEGHKLLAVQIDAAINPGNSGGPAFHQVGASAEMHQVAGVAFSRLTESDNIGYIIPTPVVRHFLREHDVHGLFRGVCSAGFRIQDLENVGLRSRYRLQPHHSGGLLYALDPLAPASKILQEHDVLLAVDGQAIADDGSVPLRGEERIDLSHIVRKHFIGDELAVRVLRDGEELSLTYTLAARRPLVPAQHSVDCWPAYFVFGGLVFVPLSMPFVEHAYGNHWRRLCPVSLLALFNDYRETAHQQIVVLFQVLAHEINFGYKLQTVRVESCNGKDLLNLRHLCDVVDTSQDEYITFRLDGGRTVILNRLAANAANPEILVQHCIPADRSSNLRGALPADDDMYDYGPAAPPPG
eukprot:jgi/Chlat1/8089/Chrsp75S07586